MSSRTQLLTPSSLRVDSRLPLELRSLSFTLLPTPSHPSPASADGYALVSHGLTKVSASVFGPREGMRTGAFAGGGGGGQGGDGDKARVNVEVGMAGWSERNKDSGSEGVRKGGRDRRTVELASTLKSTFLPVLLLHLYPRSSIDIYLQIYSVDGSLLQAAINATSLSLISSGLPMLDYICSLSLSSYPSIPTSSSPQIPPFTLSSPVPITSNTIDNSTGTGSTVLLDLTNAEEQALPNLTIAVLPRSGRVTTVALESRIGVARFEEMVRWGVEGSKVVKGAMDEAVREWAEKMGRNKVLLERKFPGMSLGGSGGAGGGGGGGKGEEMEE